VHNPEHVHLEVHHSRLGLRRERVEQRSVRTLLKLVPVHVVEESHPGVAQRAAGLHEDRHGLVDVSAREAPLVRDPRAHHLLRPERLGVLDDASDVLCQLVEVGARGRNA
jgi:hypothetical protein